MWSKTVNVRTEFVEPSSSGDSKGGREQSFMEEAPTVTGMYSDAQLDDSLFTRELGCADVVRPFTLSRFSRTILSSDLALHARGTKTI